MRLENIKIDKAFLGIFLILRDVLNDVRYLFTSLSKNDQGSAFISCCPRQQKTRLTTQERRSHANSSMVANACHVRGKNFLCTRQITEFASHVRLLFLVSSSCLVQRITCEDSPVCSVHVIIARLRIIECLQTNPADVCFASAASHVIAAVRLLNRGFASRTVFDP